MKNNNMKLKRLWAVLLMLGFLQVQAQYNIKVREGVESVGEVTNNALIVEIFECDLKDVEKAWKSELKKMNAKVQTKKGIFGDDATLKAMGENAFDVYSEVTIKDDVILLRVAVDLGGAFLSSKDHSSQYSVMENYLRNFAIATTKEGIRVKLKEEEKVLKELEKEQDDLKKEKERLEENIKNWQKEIEQAQKDIEQNLKEQDEKLKLIGEQKEIVKKVASKEYQVK